MNRRDVLAGLGTTLFPLRARARDRWMAPEWARHRACLMAWSAEHDIYGNEGLAWIHIDQVRIAKAISQFEPVWMMVNPENVQEAGQRLGGSARLIEIPLDSLWARDTSPTFGPDGATGWNFNVWGEKHPGRARDRSLAERFATKNKLSFHQAPIVAEGGAIDTDGEGTVMVTETCLLNPNRNPGMDRSQVEEALKEFVPAAHVIWLWGSQADTITDGHIDGIARFFRPGLVVAETIEDPEDPEYADLKENLARLRSARDARGERLEIITLKRPRWDRMPERGYDFAPSYVNAYFANGGIVMPRFNDPDRDAAARNLFARLWPSRKIVQIPIDSIGEGGGGIHCCTMQFPA